MKNFVTASFCLAIVLSLSSAFAGESAPYRRGLVHHCRLLLVRMGALHSKAGLNFDADVNRFLRAEWTPDAESRLSIRAQMREVTDVYGILRAEGFSGRVAKIGATRTDFEDLLTLGRLKLSDDQLVAALEATKNLVDLASLIESTTWSVDSSIMLFKRQSETIKRYGEIYNEVHDRRSSLLNVETQIRFRELSEMTALLVNLNVGRFKQFADAGISAQKTLEICERLAKDNPNNGASAEGYLSAYIHGIPDDDAFLLSLFDRDDFEEIQALRTLNFATSDIVKVLDQPYTRKVAKLVYLKARSVGHSDAEAHDIATNHALPFVRWHLAQESEQLPAELRFAIPLR